MEPESTTSMPGQELRMPVMTMVSTPAAAEAAGAGAAGVCAWEAVAHSSAAA